MLSDSQPGEPVAQAFGHLATRATREQTLQIAGRDRGSIARAPSSRAVFSRRPARRGRRADRCAADRIASAAGTRAAGGRHLGRLSLSHAPQPTRRCTSTRMARRRACTAFTCALPEHLRELPTPHVAHPGCFATATLLASVPLLALGLATPELFVAASPAAPARAASPVDGTHHPLRHGDLYAYNALAHRHAPEIVACALRRHRRRGAVRVRAAFRTIRPRHPRHGAGARCARRATRAQVLARAARVLRRRRRSCA